MKKRFSKEQTVKISGEHKTWKKASVSGRDNNINGVYYYVFIKSK